MIYGKFVNECSEIIEGIILYDLPEKDLIIAQDKKGYLHIVKSALFVCCPNRQKADPDEIVSKNYQ